MSQRSNDAGRMPLKLDVYSRDGAECLRFRSPAKALRSFNALRLSPQTLELYLIDQQRGILLRTFYAYLEAR
jgi:hypothetical protein